MSDRHLVPPALHMVNRDEARAWLADHGAVANNVFETTIRIGPDLGVFLDIVEYRLNDKGQKYYDRDADKPAQFTYTVPLRRFPVLVPADGV
ncbi:MAG: hypothetical protein EPO40_02910 [Myxococcaceae bacterium]|nr:MAG: hypothetical protein EPO40_02910 [Myxococcaceae bacterium]